MYLLRMILIISKPPPLRYKNRPKPTPCKNFEFFLNRPLARTEHFKPTPCKNFNAKQER